MAKKRSFLLPIKNPSSPGVPSTEFSVSPRVPSEQPENSSLASLSAKPATASKTTTYSRCSGRRKDPFRLLLADSHVSLEQKRDLLLSEIPVSGVELVYRLCRDFGARLEDIAEFFEVGQSSLRRWMNAIPELRDAVQRGRDECDSNKVEKSLFNRTQGYEVTEVHRERPIYKNKQTGELVFGDLVVTKEITKHLPPDTLSIIYWLKNRQKDRWRDAQEHDVNLKGKMTFVITSAIPEPDKPPPGMDE